MRDIRIALYGTTGSGEPPMPGMSKVMKSRSSSSSAIGAIASIFAPMPLKNRMGSRSVALPARQTATRKAWPGGFFVVPGVRPSNGSAGDQKRVVTPTQAMADGASILVVGRPISQSPDPDLAAREIEATL